MRKTILTAALLCAFLGTQAQEYYEKHFRQERLRHRR